jgi:hypothetical protein
MGHIENDASNNVSLPRERFTELLPGNDRKIHRHTYNSSSVAANIGCRGLCKACTDTGFVYSAKGRISNNMLYMRYVHLTKAKHIHKRQKPSSRQRGCCIRTMAARVQLKNKYLIKSLKEFGAKTN